MDMDTTSKKDGREQILDSFRRREADILVGTQMIVKGHDFPGVTLVGIFGFDISPIIVIFEAASVHSSF